MKTFSDKLLSKREKFFAFFVIIGILAIGVWSIVTNENRPNQRICLEESLNVTGEISELEKRMIDSELEKYYVKNNNKNYFSTLEISITEHPYTVYYLFYDYMMLKSLGEDVTYILSNIGYLETAIKNAVMNKEVTALDLVSYICLQYECEKTFDEELMEYFWRNFYDDENNLFCENRSNSDSSMVSFTIDICNMLSMVGLEYEKKEIEKTVEAYYQSTEFIDVNDEMNIFGAGGNALYAMDALGLDIQIDDVIQNWYDKWRKQYISLEIASWEDILVMECIFRPVSEAMRDNYDFAKVDSFIANSTNIKQLIDNFYEERLAYDLLKKHLRALTGEGKELLVEHIEKRVKYQICNILAPSIEDTYYGANLAYLTKNPEYDYEKIMCNIVDIYNDRMQIYMEQDISSTVSKMIDDTYFLLLLEYQYCEGNYRENISNMVIAVWEQVKRYIINIQDPVTLRRFCVIAGQLKEKLSYQEVREIRALYETFHQNEIILSSYYLIDLYVVDTLMGFDIISAEELTKRLVALKEGSCYYDIKIEGGSISLEATFYAYAIMSLTGIGDVNAEKELLKDEISEFFLENDSTYLPYLDRGCPRLKTMYWGICLANI